MSLVNSEIIFTFARKTIVMITGIQFEKDTYGRNAYVRIDMKKYGEKIIPLLEEIGVIDSSFEHDWQRGLTAEEFMADMQKRIEAWHDR
jgi:hypothetical protein